MPDPKPPYVITSILRDGRIKKRGPMSKAPPDGYVYDHALRHKAPYATRYFPSKKGWLLFDCRNIVKTQMTGQSFATYEGGKRLERVFPSEEAVVMYALALAQRP